MHSHLEDQLLWVHTNSVQVSLLRVNNKAMLGGDVHAPCLNFMHYHAKTSQFHLIFLWILFIALC